MIGRLCLTVGKQTYRRTPRLTGLSLRRHISWRDFNPITYASNGYTAVKNYWYGDKGSAKTEGQDREGSGGSESSQADSDGYSDLANSVPVFIDLRKKDSDHEELKLGDLSKMSILMLFRFRKYILRVIGKYLKVLFEDHYEYGLLILLFIIL